MKRLDEVLQERRKKCKVECAPPPVVLGPAHIKLTAYVYSPSLASYPDLYR